MNEKYLKEHITIYDVAKTAKVSLATVSRVINGQSNVKEATREKVLQTIEKLGYKPSALAQSLASNKTTSVGIILPAGHKSYVTNIFTGALDVAKIYGYKVSVFLVKSDGSDSFEVTETILKSRVDGVIIYHHDFDQNCIEQFVKYKLPHIYVGNKTINNKYSGSVLIEYQQALMEYLDKTPNNKHKYFINFDNCCYIHQHSIINISEENNDYIIPINDSYSMIYQYFKEKFAQKEFLDSIIITTRDTLAAAIINAANDVGVKIPEKLEVLAIISTRNSILTRPTISSFNLDLYEAGSIGMRMLTKLLKGNLDNRVFNLVASYTKRQSTLI